MKQIGIFLFSRFRELMLGLEVINQHN